MAARVGEHVGFLPSSAPENQWNATGHPYRLRLVRWLLGFPLLYFVFTFAMTIAEFTPGDYDHIFSVKTWWWLDLVNMVLAALMTLFSIFLDMQRKPVDRKQEQEWPTPPQDYRILLGTTIAMTISFAFIWHLNDLSSPAAILYLHIFLNAGFARGLGCLFALRDVIMTIRCPMTMPDASSSTKSGISDPLPL